MRMDDELQIRPFTSEEEYARMIAYYHDADDAFLRGMGVDRSKLPSPKEWLTSVVRDSKRSDAERDRCFVAWLYRREQVGHSSLSHIKPGVEGHVHLHLWRPELRRGGIGRRFFIQSVDYFFERFALQKIVCEPMAGNPAPNRVLASLGFTFVKRYRTMPVSTSFEQDVNRYEMTREQRLTR
jgi:RimJ/RimL family protein N-acetyltransferase